VLDPSLVNLIAPLRSVLARLTAVQRNGSAIVNLLENGADLLLRTDAELTAADRIILTGFADAYGLSRIAWARGNEMPEPVCLLRPPAFSLSGVTVFPPPGVFLQATAEGQAAIIAAVVAGLPQTLPARARVFELFAGCGTLTFPLSDRAHVVAYEGDGPALASLRRAAFGRRIEIVQRNLARRPLSAEELGSAAAVVLNPPYAGAAPQMAALAACRVSRIIYVSCNPATLSRDARSLHEANYHVLAATPIDQFRWSTQLESVVVFARAE
jgi:23S rRNA (uracil1939-C5)-methyltransferase